MSAIAVTEFLWLPPEVEGASSFRARDEFQSTLLMSLQSAAQELVRVTQNQYTQKAALLSDLLKAQSNLADADHQAIRTLLDLATAQADLEKAIGGDE